MANTKVTRKGTGEEVVTDKKKPKKRKQPSPSRSSPRNKKRRQGNTGTPASSPKKSGKVNTPRRKKNGRDFTPPRFTKRNKVSPAEDLLNGEEFFEHDGEKRRRSSFGLHQCPVIEFSPGWKEKKDGKVADPPNYKETMRQHGNEKNGLYALPGTPAWNIVMDKARDGIYNLPTSVAKAGEFDWGLDQVACVYPDKRIVNLARKKTGARRGKGAQQPALRVALLPGRPRHCDGEPGWMGWKKNDVLWSNVARLPNCYLWCI
jgi:hypothetical protein